MKRSYPTARNENKRVKQNMDQDIKQRRKGGEGGGGVRDSEKIVDRSSRHVGGDYFQHNIFPFPGSITLPPAAIQRKTQNKQHAQ